MTSYLGKNQVYNTPRYWAVLADRLVLVTSKTNMDKPKSNNNHCCDGIGGIITKDKTCYYQVVSVTF